MPPTHTSSSLNLPGAGKSAPKERGCFQCSRRRIVCDRGEPSCNKCTKKGIECSGLNRIRFTNGVARRGKLKDCKVPDVRAENVTLLPAKTSFPQVRWQNERKSEKKRHIVTQKLHIAAKLDRTAEAIQTTKRAGALGSLADPGGENSELAEQSHFAAINSPVFGLPLASSEQPGSPVPSVNPATPQWPTQIATQEIDDDVEEVVRNEINVSRFHSIHQRPQPWLAPLSAEARMLFTYFSETVAPAMVVLDTVSNGYRQSILPMALEDEVLRRAVGVVAAQHLSRQRPEMKDAAEAGRAAIISRLRQNAMTDIADHVFNRFTWATLIVLLVGETVTGSSDYAFLVQMLLCLSANSRTDSEDSTVTRFLQTQTNMFELLGSALIHEENGILTLSRFSQSWQDWLTCEQFTAGTENYRIIDRVRLCFAAACTIYLRRATCDASSPAHEHVSQHAAVHDLMTRVAQIPPDGPGAHALIWPCFVAGAEASDPFQREFFKTYMTSIYHRTKFRNIPLAVKNLERLWARSPNQRWTQCLAEYCNVLVM